MEYKISLLVIFLLSILTALTAKYNFITVPWFELLKKPKYLGGRKGIKRGVIYLVLWIVASLLLSTLITFTLLNSGWIAKSVYSYIGYNNPKAGSSGLITTVIFNIAIYLFLVNKTKRVLREEADNPPDDLLSVSVLKEDDDNKSRAATVHRILRRMYYYVPNLLAHIYRYFYMESNHLIQGAARLTFDDYGKETILNFFDSHIENSKSKPNRKKSPVQELSEALKRANIDGYDRALALLEMKIEVKGYFSTRKYIDNYMEKIKKEPQYEDDKRSSPRIQVRYKKSVEFTSGDGNFSAIVPEYSKNFKGIYLSTDASVNVNQPITLVFKDKKVRLKVVHKNALTSCEKRYSGFGAVLIEEKYSESLKAFLVD